MLKRLVLVCVSVGLLVLIGPGPAHASLQAGDPPPALDGADRLQLAGALVIVLVGTALVLWSLRPARPGVTRRGPGRAATSSHPAASWRPGAAAATRGSAGSDGVPAAARPGRS